VLRLCQQSCSIGGNQGALPRRSILRSSRAAAGQAQSPNAPHVDAATVGFFARPSLSSLPSKPIWQSRGPAEGAGQYFLTGHLPPAFVTKGSNRPSAVATAPSV